MKFRPLNVCTFLFKSSRLNPLRIKLVFDFGRENLSKTPSVVPVELSESSTVRLTNRLTRSNFTRCHWLSLYVFALVAMVTLPEPKSTDAAILPLVNWSSMESPFTWPV